MMQQRRDEILAKKAKLAELKRQRELRTREISSSRQSIGGSSEVRTTNSLQQWGLTGNSSQHLHQVEKTTAKN